MRSSLLMLAAVAACGAQVAVAQPPMHLTLAQAEQLAIQNNPQFSAARYNAAAAYQVAPQYKAAYSPNFSGNLTGVGADNGSRLAAGGLNNPVVYNRIGSGLTVGQMITDFGRTSNLIAMAKLNASAQDQLTESTRAQILLATGRAYFAVLRAHSVLTVATQTVAARQTVVDQVTALAESKLKSTLDVSFANVNLADAKLLLVQAQNDLKAAEADLATAIGLPNEAGFDLAEEPMPSQLPDKPADLIRQAIQNRPELKDLRLEQSAAQRFTKAEHALYYPSIGVVGTAGFVPTGVENVPGRYGAIGMNVSIPIFNGGLFKARQTEAEMKAKAAGENVNDLQNRVTRDVRVAWLNATTAYDRMALTRQLLDQATSALELAQIRYDNALGSIVELSTAQLNLTAAQIAVANAHYDYQTQRVIVDYQTGVLH
uniref:Outer membrane efflux protein n=1 Tax=Solibacter usitatus (strain Ellin6076) TaxID=234267 RepID=Q01PE5_SOLUE